MPLLLLQKLKVKNCSLAINDFATIGYPCRKQQGITPIVASITGRRIKGSRLFSLAYIPDASIGVLRFAQIKRLPSNRLSQGQDPECFTDLSLRQWETLVEEVLCCYSLKSSGADRHAEFIPSVCEGLAALAPESFARAQ